MALQDPAQEIVYRLFDIFIELQQARLSLLAGNRDLGNIVYEEKSNTKVGNALKELIDYSKIKGNTLEYDSIAPEDANLFREILKSKKLIFTEAKMYDAKLGRDRHVFITKDKDRPFVNDARNKFRYELNIGIGELSFLDFARVNENQTVFTVDGLTRSELEMFRYNAVKERFSYAVNRNTDGSYSIYYANRDEEYAKRALFLTAYDLSGDSGRRIDAAIIQTIDRQNQFARGMYPANGHVKYIVDSADPCRFICVSDHGYSTHCLEIKDKEVNDSIGIISNDYSNLLALVAELQDAVILSESQMQFIDGIDSNDNAILKNSFDDFSKGFALTLSTIDAMQDSYKTIQISSLLEEENNRTPSLIKERGDFLEHLSNRTPLSDTEKEAIGLCNNWVKKEYRIDRFFIERLASHDSSPKKTVTETHEVSHSDTDTGHSL